MMTFIVVFDSSTDEVLFLGVIYHLLAGSFPRIIDVSMRGYRLYLQRNRVVWWNLSLGVLYEVKNKAAHNQL